MIIIHLDEPFSWTCFLGFWGFLRKQSWTINLFNSFSTFLGFAHNNIFFHLKLETAVISESSSLLSGLILCGHQRRVAFHCVVMSFNHNRWWSFSQRTTVGKWGWWSLLGYLFAKEGMIECVWGWDPFGWIFF